METWDLRDEMTTILAIGFVTEQAPGDIADRILDLLDRCSAEEPATTSKIEVE